MLLIEKLAEARISEAIERGELDNLPGAGKPLEFDDDQHVPPELRAAYRVLKNAGCVPPEVQLRKEINRVEQFLTLVEDREARVVALRKLNHLMLRLNSCRNTSVDLRAEHVYFERLLQKVSR